LRFHRAAGLAGLMIFGAHMAEGQQPGVLVLENDHIRLEIARHSGAITSFHCKDNECERVPGEGLHILVEEGLHILVEKGLCTSE
jgi:hypothetical protein